MAGDETNLADYAPVEVDFTPKAPFQLLFDGLHAEQELGRPFLFLLELSSGKLESTISSLIGSACCIWLYDADNTEEPNHYFHGIVTRLVSAGLPSPGCRAAHTVTSSRSAPGFGCCRRSPTARFSRTRRRSRS